MTPVEVVALHGCTFPKDGRPCHICLDRAERHVKALTEAGMVVSRPVAATTAIPAEVVEKALREHLRIRPQERATAALRAGQPIPLSGGEAEDAARIALDALAGAGLVVVPAEDLRQAVEVIEAVNDPYRYVAAEPELLARLAAALDVPDGDRG